MDAQTKELVAIGASFAARCQPCIRHHLAKAREAGASEEDIRAAIDLGKRISAVGNDRMSEFVDNIMKD
ncbi:MAG: carboxymuconolactone decarboxylase family protein [Methanomassiliicoccales archaeon]